MDKVMNAFIQVVAHRGFSGIYPENTLIAFRKAVEMEVDFVELDVRETKDGELIVMHDERIDRTTNGTGLVREITFTELRRYDAGSWKGYPGERVPHLLEVFEHVWGKTGLLIEIKQCDIERLVSLFTKHGIKEMVFAGSFNIHYVKKIHFLLPEFPLVFISWNVPVNLSELIAIGVRQLDIHFDNLCTNRTRELVASGFLVNAWTPDKKSELLACINMGVQFITTNRPDILMEIIDNI